MDDSILHTALRLMSLEFDRFINECITEDGKPKIPSYKAVMRARGYLPPYCKNSLSKKD